jgi:hypothetical protein
LLIVATGVGHVFTAAGSPFLGLVVSKLPRFWASLAFGVGQRFGVFTICARLVPVMFSVMHPPRCPSVADGVAHNPAPLAPVRGADVSSSEHTPSRIEPHFGKITEHSGKASSHKER